MDSLIQKLHMFGPTKLLKYAQIELSAKYHRCLYGSFSQGQEDLALNRLLLSKPHGFYVDIGAADGQKYSNTHYFYCKGWQGINIEPDPENFAKLQVTRHKDINLNIAIGSNVTTATLYRFLPGVLSTLSPQVAQEFRDIGYTYIGPKEVRTNTLGAILHTYAPHQKIDFFSLDTEGYDLTILKSNDWAVFSPQLICVELEQAHQDVSQAYEQEMHRYLSSHNYTLVFDNAINRIYQFQPDHQA